MPKLVEQWLLYQVIKGELTPLSKPFKKKEDAEKARSKYPARQQKEIAIGVIRREQ